MYWSSGSFGTVGNLAFSPSVKMCLLGKDTTMKGLLILDNATTHPLCLEDDVLKLKFIGVLFPSVARQTYSSVCGPIGDFESNKFFTNHIHKVCFPH